MTKFKSYSEAVEAAKAHNINVEGGGSGNGYIINTVKGYWDGWTFIPGWFEACAKHERGSHNVRPI